MPDINLDPAADDQQLLARVVAYYHACLKADANATKFLKVRGLDHPGLIDTFLLGYADRSLGLKLPSKETKAGRTIRERLQRLGLFRDTGHEHLVGSLVVPIHAPDGSRRILDIYGRKIQAGRLRKGTLLDLHLDEKCPGVINVDGLAGRGEAVLCQSVFDALTFWVHGYRNATCVFGDTITDDMLAAFAEFNIRRVLATDEAMAEKLLAAGLEVFLVRLPIGTSVNAFALQTTDPADALGSLLRSAEWLGKGQRPSVVIQSASRTTTQKTPPLIDPDDAEPEDDDLAGDQGEGEDEVEGVREGTKSPAGSPAPNPATEPVNEGRKSSASGLAAGPDLLPSLTASRCVGGVMSKGTEPVATSPDFLPSLTGSRGRGDAGGEHGGVGFVVGHGPGTLPSFPPLRETSPLPAPAPAIEAEVGTDEATICFGTRRYRVRGFCKNLAFNTMKVNVMVSNDQGMFIDSFDLYAAKHRRSFVAQAAEELGVEETTVKNDLGKVLLKLEELQDARLKDAEKVAVAKPEMTPDEREQALALLRDPHLLDRVADDFAVVGERTNKLVAYLAAVSRKLDRPLAVLVQSTSAAGKTTLMEAVLSMIPPEDVVKFSAMTGQSLYYMPEGGLKNRILAIVEEEGAAKAGYALKLLQSEGELRIASTGKEATTGRLTTQEYRVEGPTMLFLTTTSITTDEELLNRCIVLSVNEDREQTKAIHALQRRRETLDGMLTAQAHDRVLTLHRNAQRLLRPLLVVNPHAERLTFLDAKTRARRDHQKYLTLIRAVTLLHQHQRPVRTVEHQGKTVEFIEATLDDIAIANELAGEVLGRCLDDLPPQTRALLVLLDGLVKAEAERLGIERADFRFTRREVRESTGWGDTQLKIHLSRLTDLEYLIVHRDGKTRRQVYELLYTTGDGDRALPGLIDVAVLRTGETPGYDAHRSGFSTPRSGQNGHRSGSGRPTVGPRSGGSRGEKMAPSPGDFRAGGESGPEEGKIVNTPSEKSDAS